MRAQPDRRAQTKALFSLLQELADAAGAQYVPGGATQNSIRVAQWMLGVPGATAYMGSVGDDAFAKIMKDAATA